MGADDDAALCRLSEHLGEAHHWHRFGCDEIRQHLARANRRQLVNVAYDQQGGLVGHRFQECLHQHDVDHRGLVDHQQVAIERIVVAAFEAATPGVNLQEPVDGLGIEPVASLMRLAARPVGAQSKSLTPLAARMRRIALTMVVLPTPGPPVMTRTLDMSASRIAATWLSARIIPMRFSTHGNALSGSIHGQGSVPFTSRVSRSAMLHSARCRPARNTQGISPIRSAMTVPSVNSRSSAVRTSSPGTSSSFSASGTSSSVGSPQWPSSMASVSA